MESAIESGLGHLERRWVCLCLWGLGQSQVPLIALLFLGLILKKRLPTSSEKRPWKAEHLSKESCA